MRTTLVLLLAIQLSLIAVDCAVASQDVKVLLLGSHGREPDNWINKESYLIENLLKFNGIRYEFFDLSVDSLQQSKLDQYHAVIIEVYALVWDGSVQERTLLAQNMESGAITALVGLVRGTYTSLNSTIYAAIDVSVDGAGNSESDIILGPGATNIYDFEGDEGFIVTGGYGGKHVGMSVNSLGRWSFVRPAFCGDRVAGAEVALQRWMQNAFGVDARVTMPTVSLYLSDTQTTPHPRSQELIDFIDGTKDRIRASGFLVTNASAYQGTDSVLMDDERILSEWGSMALHGKDHGTVGAEGENRDFQTQYDDMSAAVAFLQEHFPNYKPIKGPPNLSWNEATLHAMYQCGIPYHSATIRKGPDYQVLYKSVLDAADELDRERLFARGEFSGLRYYPFYHSDATGEAWIYSVDYYVSFTALDDPEEVPDMMKAGTIDWWTPVLAATHFSSPDSSGAALNPTGWIAVMAALMDLVDHDSYPYRRWLDTHDYAQNIQRFDQDLTINAVSVCGDVITYDITASQPIGFLTLKAASPGYRVQSATINGVDHCYFGDDYVHLPELSGNAVIMVNLTSGEDCWPHVTHITPNAVIDSALYDDGKLDLALGGEFQATVRLAGSGKVFTAGTTTVLNDSTEQLQIDVSSSARSKQVQLSLSPDSSSVSAEILTWDPLDPELRSWVEWAQRPDVRVEHTVGDLCPGTGYVITANGCFIDSCLSNGSGEVEFDCFQSCPACTMMVVADSSLAGRLKPDPSGSTSPLTSRPNPAASPGTVISYGLPRQSPVILSIYSCRGRLVRTLVNGIQPAGLHSMAWDGLDSRARPVSPGLYFCKLETPARLETRKIVVLR